MYIILTISKNPAFAEMIRSVFSKEPAVVDVWKDFPDFIDYLPGHTPSLIIADCSTCHLKSFKILFRYLAGRYLGEFVLTGTPGQLALFQSYLLQQKTVFHAMDQTAPGFKAALLSLFSMKKTPKYCIPQEALFTANDTREFQMLLENASSSSFSFRKYQSCFPLYQFFTCIVKLEEPFAVTRALYKIGKATHDFLLLKSQGQKAILIFWSYVDQYQTLMTLREKLIHDCKLRNTSAIWVGCIHTSLYGAYKSFLEAKETCYIHDLYHPAVCFDEISSSVKTASKPLRLVEIERQIRANLEYKNGDSIIALTQEWFQECVNMNYTLENIQMDLLNLYSSIKYVIFDMYTLHSTRIKKGWEVYELFQIRSLDTLKDWFFDWLNYTLSNIQIKKRQGFCIEDILEFIDYHLMEKITLENTAGYFGYNTSYFSSMFKKEAQETFISYVSRQKMSKAYELLQSGRKVSEVAALLGYSDLKHFRTLFKQQFQIPPSAVPPFAVYELPSE